MPWPWSRTLKPHWPELDSGVVAQGYYTSVVILMDEDRQVVQDCARRVEKVDQLDRVYCTH